MLSVYNALSFFSASSNIFQKKLALATFIFVRTWALYVRTRHSIREISQLTLAFSPDNVYVNLQTQRWKIFYKFVCHHSSSFLHYCSCSSTHGDPCNVGIALCDKIEHWEWFEREHELLEFAAQRQQPTTKIAHTMMMMAGRARRRIHHAESYRYRHNKTCQCCTYYNSP